MFRDIETITTCCLFIPVSSHVL